MSRFVLDTTVAMRWHLESPEKYEQKYAEAVLKSMSYAEAMVPVFWHLEATNALLGAEFCKDTTTGEVEAFIAQIESLPLFVDPLTSRQSFSRTLSLGRAYSLSSFDASYLELAIREGVPIASLNESLRKAASKSGVAVYLN